MAVSTTTHRRKYWIGFAVLGALLLLPTLLADVIKLVVEEPPKQSDALVTAPVEEKLAPVSLVDLEQRIGPYAVAPMTKADYPTYFRVLGPARFDLANNLTRWAAIAAAEHRGICDEVEMVGISDQTSRQNIVWYAYCANGQRIMVSEAQATEAKRRFGSDA